MNSQQARDLVCDTFQKAFDKVRFHQFAKELLNGFNEDKSAPMQVPDAYAPHVRSCARLGTYEAPDGEFADVLIVHTTEPWKLERTRTALRDFVAHKLKRGDSYKEAGLVAFVAPDARSWRFSFVRMEYESKRDPKTGKIAVEERLTPARRFSYIVGEDESCHTAQSRFLELLEDTDNKPTLEKIEKAFSVEAVTKEFFEQYKELFLRLAEELDAIAKKDKAIGAEFAEKKVSTADFGKKLMGQIVFLYFLQKKGWLGVAKGGDWGDGTHNFLRQLYDKKFGGYENFFNDILEPLFYDTLATDRGHEAWCSIFKCRIPFLNGGLFEPVAGYDWKKTDITIPNSLFSNSKKTEAGDDGTGILDVFDRYNFTVNEAEPLEKEVAIDPEMLGKVFENLLEVKERKSKGSFYTPREIVHYMCQESLINYLDTAINTKTELVGTERRKQGLLGDDKAEQTLLTVPTRGELIPRADIETFIHSGDQISHYEAVETRYVGREMPKKIKDHAKLLDEKLADIAVCDPAIGSGAFPVGMMQEIVRARSALTPYFNDVKDRTAYHFKRHAIQNCIYGVDIDPGAVEIAKLRLWLSLVVDEEDVKQIKPLPNLDYKIVSGNSLLGVEKNLLNKLAYEHLEKLKPRFFDATEKKAKEKIKGEIDVLIHELTNGKEIFDFEIYFSEVMDRTRKSGFDIVIGNPPYGFRNVLTAEDKKYFRKERGIQFPSGDVAELFIIISADKLTRPNGTLTFIIPKKSLYGESWTNVRKLWLENSVGFLMDASQAFENVLLEQAAFSVQKVKLKQPKEIAVGWLNADIPAVEVFGTFNLKDIFTDDLRNAQIYKGLYSKALLQKIKQHSIENTSGLIRAEIGISNITPDLTFESEGNYPCVKGIDIERYGLKPNIRYLKHSTAKRYIDDYQHEKLIAQEIIAHIQNPQPHILVTMFFDDGKRLFNDTCVEIQAPSGKLDLKFLMGYFHSTFANWYAYNFVYNRAIRTMHFINYYVTQIAIPKSVVEDPSKQKPIIKLVERILAAKAKAADADVRQWEREIDELVYALYALTPEEIKIVEGTPLHPNQK
jgi:type I restriction-modification system DNA methylase subunit